MSYLITDTINELNFALRTKLFLNSGAIDSIGEIASDLGIRRVLIVTGPVTGKSQALEKAAQNLRADGIERVVWDQVSPEPDESVVEACAHAFYHDTCDGIIGIGGGSSMDTAKLAACLVSGGGAISEYDSLVQERRVPADLPPLICAPTTAGTGSEVTCMAAFTRSDDQSKRVVADPNLYPHAALVDPVLSWSMPPELTACTGMDAFSHAVEAYLSTMANPISDALALYAMELVAEFLPRAVKNGRDHEARLKMSVAASMAGIAINHALPHFAHAIGHVLGPRFGLAHGMACGMVLPAGLRALRDVLPDKFGKIARVFGLEPDAFATPEDVAEAAIGAIEKMTMEIGLPRISDVINGQKDKLHEIAALASAEPAMMFSPQPLFEEEILRILVS